MALIVFATCSFLTWALWIPKPQPEAFEALSQSESVSVGLEPHTIFRPTKRDLRIGLILYPGARVDARAYAPLAKLLAADGVTVVIPSMPLNLAVFSPNAAAAIISETEGIERWYVAGHSLGGTMAADFASRNPDRVSGLVLLASYPLAGSGLAGSDLPVVSIYGTNDQIATLSEVNASRIDLPTTTRWVEIIGGNHSQFGWYGDQSGDGTASISREEQTRQIAEAILQFINVSAAGDPRR